ncbi:MAG: branched-chain amino acid ABC transporter permease [Alphaproteobacteria bacterium]|nr:branched-chain amino acid ABC transporter permease [Alphaproteobacteria bacterium]
MSELAIVAESVLQALSAGLLIGCIYGLMCLGLSLIFGIMRVINFAQGEFLMLGMYFAFYAMAAFGALGILGPLVGPFVAALLAAPALFVFGYLLHLLLVRRVTGVRAVGTEGEGHYAQLILTLGISLIVANGSLVAFGSFPQVVKTPLSSTAWELGPLYGDFVLVFVNQARAWSSLVSIAAAIGLVLFMSRSALGKSLLAAADNPEAAIYMGIDVDRAHRIAFAIGTAVTAVAGGLVATYYPFQPYVGIEFVIIMYAGVVLGGIGSVSGAFLGGLSIGLVQQLSTLVLPIQLQNAAIFVMFLLVVMFRPHGLFGRSAERT